MKGHETDAEQVETISHEGAVVEGEIVGDDLYDDLHGENGSEEVVEVAIARRVSVQRVFSGQHARRDHNAS